MNWLAQGDSGFLLVRDGRPFFKSPVLQHHFVRARSIYPVQPTCVTCTALCPV